VASKASARGKEGLADLGESIEALEKLIDRTKVLYEQYFLGVQKMPPLQLHRDLERKLRDLTQMQASIKKGALKYRLTNLGQKFGSYNTYWKRTMREIERGTYIRDVARVGRRAVRSGEEIPAEILAAMPKRMREKVVRERARIAARKGKAKGNAVADPAPRKSGGNVHQISEEDALLGGDFDIDALFADMTAPAAASPDPVSAAPPPTPQKPPRAKPVPARVAPAKAAPPKIPAAAGSTPKGRPRRPLPPGMSERQSKELYEKYVQAHESVGDKSGPSYDKLMNTLRSQAPKIMKEHGASRVDFNVVVKGKKVVLKAKPIK